MSIFTNTHKPKYAERKQAVCASHRVGERELSTIIKFILLIFVCRSYYSWWLNREIRKRTGKKIPTINTLQCTNSTMSNVEWVNYMGHIDDIFAFQLDVTPQFMLHVWIYWPSSLVRSLARSRFIFFFLSINETQFGWIPNIQYTLERRRTHSIMCIFQKVISRDTLVRRAVCRYIEISVKIVISRLNRSRVLCLHVMKIQQM